MDERSRRILDYNFSIIEDAKIDISPAPIVKAESLETIPTEPITEKETEKETELETYKPKHNYSEDDIYYLAKIVMAEAEGESLLCKEYIAQTVINRTQSDEFPDTIIDVIYDPGQFTPVSSGRWDAVEPNQECYDAVFNVINADYPIIDSLYFESCKGDSWHSRNLETITQASNTRFYK